MFLILNYFKYLRVFTKIGSTWKWCTNFRIRVKSVTQCENNLGLRFKSQLQLRNHNNEECPIPQRFTRPQRSTFMKQPQPPEGGRRLSQGCSPAVADVTMLVVFREVPTVHIDLCPRQRPSTSSSSLPRHSKHARMQACGNGGNLTGRGCGFNN